MTTYPTIVIDSHAEYAVATFDYPGYSEPFHIIARKLDWVDEDEDPFVVSDSGDADPRRFATFHEAVEALLREAADQMEIDRAVKA